MTILLFSIFSGVAIGVLTISIIGKLWHIVFVSHSSTEIFGFLIPEWFVTLSEIVVIFLFYFFISSLPNVSAVIIALYYSALLIVATRLRGEKCNCFGGSNKKIGRTHISGLSVIVTLAMFNIIFATESLLLSWHLGSIVLSSIIIIVWRRERQGDFDVNMEAEFGGVDQINNVKKVLILKQEGCKACEALESLINSSDFSSEVIFERHDDNDIAVKFRVTSYPSAILFDQDGDPVGSSPIIGITGILSLLVRMKREELAPKGK